MASDAIYYGKADHAIWSSSVDSSINTVLNISSFQSISAIMSYNPIQNQKASLGYMFRYKLPPNI